MKTTTTTVTTRSTKIGMTKLHKKSAQSLVQRVICHPMFVKTRLMRRLSADVGEFVRIDGTVSSMRTHEHACLPSLYVLEVIEPHSCVDPKYGKLHVGNIFDSSNVNTNMVSIAAIQVEDAIDRKLQPSSAPNPHGNGGTYKWSSGGVLLLMNWPLTRGG